MTARDLIHDALEAASPHVIRIMDDEAYAGRMVRHLAAKLTAERDGTEPPKPMAPCIVVVAPRADELVGLRGKPPRATTYRVHIGEICNSFTNLTAAQMFAQAVLMGKEQA